jgi:hypothetical protein
MSVIGYVRVSTTDQDPQFSARSRAIALRTRCAHSWSCCRVPSSSRWGARLTRLRDSGVEPHFAVPYPGAYVSAETRLANCAAAAEKINAWRAEKG